LGEILLIILNKKILEHFDVKPGNYIGTKEKIQLITKTIYQKEGKGNSKKKSSIS